MLKDTIKKYHDLVRLFQYRFFCSVRERESALSSTDAYIVDVVNVLGKPTIKQFSDCLGISQPNASYKVSSLIAKGYLFKEPSPDDRREYRLSITDKMKNYYGELDALYEDAVQRLEAKYTPEQMEVFEEMLCEIFARDWDAD